MHLYILFRQRQILQAEEGEFVPITALKNYLIILHMKKSAAAQSVRVFPFQHCPLPVLKEIFFNSDHLRMSELRFKHLPDGFSAD